MLNFSHILKGRDEIQSLISNKKARLQTADDWIAHVTTAFEKAERCESKLSDEVLSLKGMCGRFTRHFYNNICDFENCRYLEIGSWTGASLCSAMFQNHIIAVSIDNWSQFGGPKEKYFENVSKYKGACNLSTLEQDCFNTDKETLGTFNVYLYDGSHSWEDQYNALVQYYDNLEDLAVIIIDDWNWKDTQFGTRKAIRDLHLPIVLEKEILLEEKDLQGMPRHTGKETWWNGIYVMIIDKNLRKQKPPSLYLSQDLQKEKPAIIQNKTDSPINIIVFSKDRACQLEALLRSMETYFHYPHITYVLYHASTPEFERGYNRLINKQKNIIWVRQTDFKSDFLSLINTTVRKEYPYLMFLVDDIIFVREFTGKPLLERFDLDQDILAVSLRMGENITYCYTRDISTTPPTFLPGNRWEWRTASPGYWNYPMSQDGHIFRTTEIIESLSPLSFTNPNTLEAISAAHPIDKPYLMCDRRPCLINLPLNVVQNVYRNRHGSITEEMLNKYFLEGLVIDIQPMAQKAYTSCHVEKDIRLFNDRREVFLHNKQPTY